MLLASARSRTTPEMVFSIFIVLPSYGIRNCLFSNPGGGLAPCANSRLAIENLSDPQPRPSSGFLGQRLGIEEAATDNFMVGLGQAILRKLPDHIDRNMVAAGNVAVEEQGVQGRAPPDMR